MQVMQIEQLKNKYFTEYGNLLKIFENFITNYGKEIYKIEDWIKIERDRDGNEYAVNMNIFGILPYLHNVKQNIQTLQFILFDIFDAIATSDDGIIQSFYKPRYMTELWYQKAYTIIIDLEYLKIKNIKRNDSEIKNIQLIRNNMIEHFCNGDENKNLSVVDFIIQKENFNVQTKHVLNKKGKEIKSHTLVENNDNLLRYLNSKISS